MSDTTLADYILADTTALLAVLTTAASSIDYSASVAAVTSATGAVDIANVAGLSLLARIDAVRDQITTLVATPATLATSLIALVQGFAGTTVDFRNLADNIAAITWIDHWFWQNVYALQTATNRDALQTLLVNQAVIEAVRAASTMTFDSQQSAFAMGEDLGSRLDDVIENASSRAMRASLRALKTAMLADIAARAAQLDALETWVNPGEAPALVLASRIYDDPTMAPDIVARNADAIVNPLFVSAGALTILTPEATS